MPGWVQQGYEEYSRRMRGPSKLRLVEITARRRGKGADIERIRRDEGQKMLAAIPPGCLVIALEVNGETWDTPALARQLQSWQTRGGDVALLVGGPDGLSAACRERADRLWSLSALTLPHPLVRILVAEQLYRAQSILDNHPYHRA